MGISPNGGGFVREMGPRLFQGNRSVGEILFHLARSMDKNQKTSHKKLMDIIIWPDQWGISFSRGPLFSGAKMLVSGRVKSKKSHQKP